jgi:hypothetical protein
MIRWAALLLLACGGSSEPEPFGWCCDGYCGLTANESAYFERCECDGVVERPEGDKRGECVEPLTE